MEPERLPLLGAQPKKRSTLLTVCPWILGNELCERLAYYGLATNLVTYITQVLGGDPAFAAILVAIFEGTCYTTPILGALLADSRWGRYKTILVFSSIYLVGIVLLTASSLFPCRKDEVGQADPMQYGVLLAALAIISLGTGGIKPNVSAFGADQFNEADPQDRREKESFFNWFYLAINVGSLFAGTVIVFIQDQVSWTIGFAIPGVAMMIAVILFWMGRNVYTYVLPTESPMTRVVRVVIAAVKNRWQKHATPDISNHGTPHVISDSSHLGSASYHGAGLYQQAVMRSASLQSGADGGSHHHSRGLGKVVMNGNGHGPGLSPLGGGGGGMTRHDSMLQMPTHASMSYRWLEDAVTEWQTSQGQLVQAEGLAGYTPKQVEEVKLVLRLLPIFATTVAYWTVYTQMGTLFVQQGNLMWRTFTWDGQTLKVPSASMSVFNTLSIIVLIYIYDAWFEPFLKRSQRFKMTLLRRQGWGMVVAAIAMVYAGVLESRRLASVPHLSAYCPPSMCDDPLDPKDDYGSLGVSISMTAGGGSEGLTGPFGGMGSVARSLLQQAGQGVASAVLGRAGRAGSGIGGGGDDLGLSQLGSGSWPSPADDGGKDYGDDGRTCMCPNEISHLSILWQAPAYFLIGLSEVFTSIGQLEFFYDQAPDVMRSCSMALCLLSTAIGSYLAGALTAVVQIVTQSAFGQEWLARDLNQGHMDYFFHLLAVLMAVNLVAFVAVAVRYQYKAVVHKRHVVLGTEAAGMEPGQVPPAMPTTTGPPSAGRRSFTGPTAPIAIGGAGRAQTAPPVPGALGELPENLEVYARSLAYVPPSPNIPAPFR